MADGATTNLALVLPEVGASADTWGQKLNDNFTALDALFDAAGANLGLDHLPFGSGRQVLQTNALGTAAEWTSSLSLAGTLGVTGAATLSNTLAVTGAATFGNTVSATRYTSTIATGTSPLAVTSTTVVANLNADRVDGFHVSDLDSRYIVASTFDASDVNPGTFPSGIFHFSGSVRPAATATHNLGDSTLRWNVLWVGSVDASSVDATSILAGTTGVASVGPIDTDSTIAADGAATFRSTCSVTGTLTAGALNLGGATVTDILSTTLLWDPADVLANNRQSTTVTVTGAAVGDQVVVNNVWKADSDWLVLEAYVSAANTVTLVLLNPGTVTASPTSRTVRVSVLKF